ncbi:MAG: DMT family transporter [Treponema sp.]|nr:DMT family transporter [Treponema sp.]
MKNTKTQSYIMFISSMLIYGTIGIFRRYIPVSSALLAFIRGLMGATILFCFVKLQGKKIRHGIGKKNLLLLALSGAAMGFNWIFLFEAYNYTTVATATLCYYMEPTIVVFLAPLIFKEKLTTKKIICALISLLGMIFVSGILNSHKLQPQELKGIAFGLGAAVLYSTVVVLNKLVQVEDAYEKTIIQLLSSALVLIPYLLLTQNFSSIKLSLVSIIMIVIVGVFHTGIAYALYFGSLKELSSQSIAVLSYIDPVSALILSAIILHENLTLYGIIGAVLIIGAALCSELKLKKNQE